MVCIKPLLLTVIIPCLAIGTRFVCVLILNKPLPLPIATLAVSQDGSLLVTVHNPVDSTWTTALFAPDVGIHSDIDSERGEAAACVIVIMRVGAPSAVTVIVPVLGVVTVFAVVVILNEPLPVRFAGLKSSTLSQVGLLLVTFHVLFDVTATYPKVEAAGDAPLSADNTRTGPGCWTTVTVRVDAPCAVIATVPVLVPFPVCGAVLILNAPLPVRLDGVTWLIVSQSLLVVGIFHVLSEYILALAKLGLAGDSQYSPDNTKPCPGSWIILTVRECAPGAETVIVPVRAEFPKFADIVFI